MNGNIIKLNEYINNSFNIAVITGAGISTACGIPDFRGPNGLYSRTDIDAEKIFDVNYFYKNPEYFYSVMKEFLTTCSETEPSAAHMFINRLEKKGKLRILITQNIDGLHEKAGNKKMICAHGSYIKMICSKCGNSSNTMDHMPFNGIPFCEKCGSVLKPDIVFFGETVKGMDEALKAVGECDLLLAIGTSFTVYPVASLPEYKKPGCPFIIINKGRTAFDNSADLKIEEDINSVFTE